MKSRIVNIVLLIMSVAATLLVIQNLPEIVPVHFDQYGVADGWGSKYQLLIFPGIILMMQLIGELCTYHYKKSLADCTDEKKSAELSSNLKILNIVFVITSALLLVINGVVLYMTLVQIDNQGLQNNIDIVKIEVIALGIFYIILGNFMPKTRINGLVGFRCKWTMYNDVTWKKSNYFGAVGMMILGFLTVIAGIAFDGISGIAVMLALLTAFIIVILIYAFKVYKKEIAKENQEEKQEK